MAKHDKIKLPKRVAGVKIPKVIRKGPLGQFLNSHAGQVILAEAVVAAAAIFTAAKAEGESAVAEGLRHPVEGVERLGHAMALTATDHSERLAHAFRAAGRAFRESLQGGYANVWQDRRDIGADEAPARKKSSGRSHATRH
jgi:hypothetical protein